MSNPSLVRREDRDGVAWLTLDRPQAYNALSMDLMADLQEVLDAIAIDRGVRVVVLGGAGRGFCAGHDLKEMRGNGERAFHEAVFARCSRLMLSLVRLPQPVIARVHGIATAAGCQLVASCDLAVAADSARFGTPGVNIGLFCSTPMVALSRNIGRKQAMQMLLTGEMIDAPAALAFGLINEVVPESELDAAVAALAAKIAAKSAYTLRVGKEAFYRQAELGLEEAYALTAQVMVENMLARDAGEGIDAFLEKRPPVWCDG
jgi:enoyl-CoA hydratase/carnithine racemase